MKEIIWARIIGFHRYIFGWLRLDARVVWREESGG